VEVDALWKGVSIPDECTDESLEVVVGLLLDTPSVFPSAYIFMLLATLCESSSEVIPSSSDSRVLDGLRERKRCIERPVLRSPGLRERGDLTLISRLSGLAWNLANAGIPVHYQVRCTSPGLT
jgi:hypothetical protein